MHLGARVLECPQRLSLNFWRHSIACGESILSLSLSLYISRAREVAHYPPHVALLCRSVCALARSTPTRRSLLPHHPPSSSPTLATMSTSTPEELFKNAEKKASASGGWFSSATSKQEEAVELFKAAANKFRIANRFEEAGNAYMRAAETETKTGEKEYAANTFFEANKCFRMSRPELAVVALTRAREILIERGRFRQAADREKAVAELYKNEAADGEKALEAYEQAAAWYLQEGANATASGCYREAAQLATDLGRFPQAIERWEQVASMSLESNLTRYSVKDYYLNAGMCYLAIPVSADPSSSTQAMLTGLNTDFSHSIVVGYVRTTLQQSARCNSTQNKIQASLQPWKVVSSTPSSKHAKKAICKHLTVEYRNTTELKRFRAGRHHSCVRCERGFRMNRIFPKPFPRLEVLFQRSNVSCLSHSSQTGLVCVCQGDLSHCAWVVDQ